MQRKNRYMAVNPSAAFCNKINLYAISLEVNYAKR